MAAPVGPGELERLRQNPQEARGISKLARLRAGARATKPDVIPAGGQYEETPFVWRILGGTEKQEAMAAAVERLSVINIPLELQGAEPLEDELGWQTLARAMRDPEDVEAPLAASVDELRQLLTTDERDILMTRYADFEEQVYPAPHELTEAELLALEEAAKKKSPESQAQLMSFGTWTLALFATSLVARLEMLTSGSSGTSPAPETGSSSAT